MGYGASRKGISTSRFWELTEKLPVVIEMVDFATVLEKFYDDIAQDLQQMKKGCMVTMEPITVKMLKTGAK
jgi:uncharacterized protein